LLDFKRNYRIKGTGIQMKKQEEKLSQMQIRHLVKRVGEIEATKLVEIEANQRDRYTTKSYVRNGVWRGIPEEVLEAAENMVAKTVMPETIKLNKNDILKALQNINSKQAPSHISVLAPKCMTRIAKAKDNFIQKYLDGVDARINAVKNAATKLRDEIILGTGSDAAKALAAFEKKKF